MAQVSVCLIVSMLSTAAGAASLTWDWAFSLVATYPPQVVLSGTFTTTDSADADGFYEITALTGNRLGVEIVSLQPKGTAIPDNEPYKVDNLIRQTHPGGQITKAGFGYGLANGWYENPFLATWELPDLVYFAFLTKPPFGTNDPQTEEPQVNFQASIRVPEPISVALLFSGLIAMAWVRVTAGRSQLRPGAHQAADSSRQAP